MIMNMIMLMILIRPSYATHHYIIHRSGPIGVSLSWAFSGGVKWGWKPLFGFGGILGYSNIHITMLTKYVNYVNYG